MEVMRYRVKLDMEDSGILKTQMRLKQGDSAITLVFKIMKNGVDVFNEADVPVVVFRRPDGTSIVGDASVAEGQYTYSLEGNELQIAGQMIADVKFNVNSARESTCSFSFECVPDTMSPDTDPAGVFVNSLKDIIDAVQKGVEQVEQAVEIFDVQQIIDLKNQIEALIEQLPDFTVDDAFSDTSDHAIMNKVVTQAINSIQNALNSLSAVATSGSYNDLTDKPDEYSLPVASESTLGGVKAVNKTAEMTQAVGIDADGNLYAEAGGEKFIDLANEAAYDELTPEEKAQNCYVYEAEEVEPSAETIAYKQGGAESIKTEIIKRDSYTTEEKLIGKWIDGSNLYSRTIEFTSPSNSTVTNLPALPFSFKLRSLKGVASISDVNNRPIPWYLSSSDSLSVWQRTATQLAVQTPNLFSVPVVVTIEYTKN